MATLVFTDAYVSIAATGATKDLSAWVESVSLPYSAEMLDATAMGDGTRKNQGGLKNWSCDVNFRQDFAADAPDVSLFGLVGSAVDLVVRPVKDEVVGATNPEYKGRGILESYQPVGNSVGELAGATVTIQSAGTLTRATEA